MSRTGAETAALQRTLAAEHAAVYGYGVVGAHLPAVLRGAALAALDAHRVRRDGLQALLRARSAQPVAAAPAYDLPEPVTTPAAALRLAVHLEEGTAASYDALVANTTQVGLRRLAAAAMAEEAVRAAGWRLRLGVHPVTVSFPGRP